MNIPALRAENLSFSYRTEAGVVPAVQGISFAVHPGEIIAIQGPSGSGKSTLLYLLGLLLHPESGKLEIHGTDISNLEDQALARLRNRSLGFVFQHFHLLPRASILDNLLLPETYSSPTGIPRPEAIERARQIARRLGIEGQLEKRPNQLSGGQQQRVAIGRALLNEPRLLLADEPTGNLDSATAGETLKLLRELAREGRAVIVITHDSQVARSCDRVLSYRDGKIVTEERHSEVATQAAQMNEELEWPKPAALPHWGTRLRSLLLSFRTHLPQAAQNLKRHRARSFLTMLGVTIGIASVLAMTTLGSFVKERLLESYQTLGVNKVMLYGWPNNELKAQDRFGLLFRDFDWEKDIAPLKTIFREISYLSPVYQGWNDTADFGGREMPNVRSLGVNSDYFTIALRTLEEGRYFTPLHIDQVSPVCLIGAEVKKELFRDVPAVGQILHVQMAGGSLDYTCHILGVLAPQSSNQGWMRPDWEILIPYTLYQFLTGVQAAGRVGIAIQIAPDFDPEAAGRQIQGYFETKYGQTGRFMIGSDAALIGQMKRFLTLFAVLLFGIALVSLIVGAVGITNMMLVSVSERVREIGLRRALGAPARSIRTQFLIESSLLCWLAGLGGLLLGFGTYEALIGVASHVVENLSFEWVMLPGAWFVSVIAIVATGIISGIVPALRAEKIEVVEALRTE